MIGRTVMKQFIEKKRNTKTFHLKEKRNIVKASAPKRSKRLGAFSLL